MGRVEGKTAENIQYCVDIVRDRLHSAAGRYDIPPHPWHSSIRRAGKVAPRDRTFDRPLVCDAGRWIGCDDELHFAQEGKAFGHGGLGVDFDLCRQWARWADIVKIAASPGA